MKPRYIVRALVALSLLAGSSIAQAPPPPTITSIPSRKAFDPRNLVVNGSNMGLVTEVRVNGTSVPILRVTSTRLVAGPLELQDPGFGTVELIHNRGTALGTIEFTPTLKASRRGMRVTSILNNGDVGAYVLRYSYTRLPSLEVDQGIYYGRLIPLDSAMLSAGVFTDTTSVTIVSRLPIQIGLIGAPLNLQALCTVGVDAVQSYSNLAAVPGFGQHQ